MSPVRAPERPGALSSRVAETRTGNRHTKGWFIGEEPTFRSRAFWLLLAFIAMAITLGGRLVDVQVRQAGDLRARAQSEHQRAITLLGHRGRIYDSGGKVLASDIVVYDIFADPSIIPVDDRPRVAGALAPVLNMGAGLVESLISQPTQFVYLAKGVSSSVRDTLTKLELEGIGATPRDQRIYVPSALNNNSFAEPLLGYVDGDGRGTYGVEQYYNGILGGVNGHESTLRDLDGNAIVLSNDGRQDPVNGKDLQLGLDSSVQYWAEQALAKGVATAEASSGQVLVMDTKTGEIKAWAQYPSYNANASGSADVGSFKDRGIADLYEPGSTEKVVTFAGGLNSGAITPQTPLNEHPLTIDGYTISDWDHRAHGNITMQTVLDQSLNNGAIRVQQLTGQDTFYKTLLGFGIGSPTGVDLAGEQYQPLAPQAQWSDIDFATAAFGQHIQVTPVEMLAAINAVGNGGVWVTPHAVSSIVDPVTGKATPVVPSTRRVMTTKSAATLATMMTGVVEHKGGEGFLARIPGFTGQVAGKTGTADEPTNGRYAGDLVVSFGGFLPASNPRFTMLVVLQHPQEHKIQRFGAFLAAPVFREVAEVMINQWRIQAK